MYAILLRPPDGDQSPTLDIEIEGRVVLTVGLAQLAPARSAWFPREGILLLDESAVTR